MNNSLLPPKSECTGCGACYNICPKQAITMGYSENYKFILPQIDEQKCVDCGLCRETCPVIRPNLSNTPTPKFYSYCAEDSVRKKSSSGGMFYSLADYILNKGGYVCGAAFDGDFRVKHKIINSKADLEPLCYSKYVQSDVQNCYKEIKALLDDDKYVFFCGTPCQVAALRNVLKKDYEKLLTADLLCHGVPSQRLFDTYLKEISHGKKVKNVYFRHKRFGWSAGTILISFEDGSEYVGKIKTEKKDAYFEAYLRNMIMRDSCYNCKFCGYPRQGDITIGDLWHPEKLDPKSNDKKGTSFVFVNNSKGERVFEEICKSAKYYNNIPVNNYSKIPNRVNPKTKPNPLRRRFFGLLDSKGFIKAFNYSYNKRYDIGLVCAIGNHNIGSILTYYALYNFLTDNNFSVAMIERPLTASLATSELAAEFTQKWMPEYSQPIRKNNIFEMRELNEQCDQFLVGSDQIFLQSFAQTRDYVYFLTWVNQFKNKIGYSCSFGGPGARGTAKYYQALTHYLNKFSFLSCREDDGVDFANNELRLDKKVEWSIDPVFLCDKEHYMKLIRTVNIKRDREYIGTYVLVPKTPISDLIIKVKNRFGNLPVELIGEEAKILKTKILIKYNHHDIFPIENSLETIYNSKFFVTDSFHGMCFAIIFKKDFLVIPRDFIDRFTSLLKRLGLENRVIKGDLSNLNESLFEPIDYDKVYEKLDREIEKSKTMLLSALQSEKSDKLSDEDIMMKYIIDQSREIQEVKNAVETLSESLFAKTGSEASDNMTAEQILKRIAELEKETNRLKDLLQKNKCF